MSQQIDQEHLTQLFGRTPNRDYTAKELIGRQIDVRLYDGTKVRYRIGPSTYEGVNDFWFFRAEQMAVLEGKESAYTARIQGFVTSSDGFWQWANNGGISDPCTGLGLVD